EIAGDRRRAAHLRIRRRDDRRQVVEQKAARAARGADTKTNGRTGRHARERDLDAADLRHRERMRVRWAERQERAGEAFADRRRGWRRRRRRDGIAAGGREERG